MKPPDSTFICEVTLSHTKQLRPTTRALRVQLYETLKWESGRDPRTSGRCDDPVALPDVRVLLAMQMVSSARPMCTPRLCKRGVSVIMVIRRQASSKSRTTQGQVDSNKS